jgi:hypothetical protein
VVEDDAMLLVGLIARGAIEETPPFERGFESVSRLPVKSCAECARKLI